MISLKKFDVSDFVVVLSFSLLPVYIYSSGGVQPSHILFFVFGLSFFVCRGISKSWCLVVFLISIYVFCVEVFYIHSGENYDKMLLNAVYFLFNFMIVESIRRYVYIKGEGAIIKGVYVSALVAFLGLLTLGFDMKLGAGGGRYTGFFNNPNQLGFFSVILLSFFCLFYLCKKIKYPSLIVGLMFSLFLSVLSLSKAAMISNAIVFFWAAKPRAGFLNFIFCSLFFLIFVFYLVNAYQLGMLDDYAFVNRIEGMSGESDNSLQSRGYFAILDASFFQFFFGLGSHGVSEILGHEVHSTFGSMLNNYGVIGLALLLCFYFIWVTKIRSTLGWGGVVCIILPSVLYGITHNGNRFVFFWLLVSVSISMSEVISKKNIS